MMGKLIIFCMDNKTMSSRMRSERAQETDLTMRGSGVEVHGRSHDARSVHNPLYVRDDPMAS